MREKWGGVPTETVSELSTVYMSVEAEKDTEGAVVMSLEMGTAAAVVISVLLRHQMNLFAALMWVLCFYAHKQVSSVPTPL